MRKVFTVVALVAGLALGAFSSYSPPAEAQVGLTCGTPTHTVTAVGTSAVAVPASPLSGRRWIDLCYSVESADQSGKVKCRQDGVNPVMGVANVGDVLGAGDCVRYGVGSGTAVKCISDKASGVVVTARECLAVY